MWEGGRKLAGSLGGEPPFYGLYLWLAGWLAWLGRVVKYVPKAGWVSVVASKVLRTPYSVRSGLEVATLPVCFTPYSVIRTEYGYCFISGSCHIII